MCMEHYGFPTRSYEEVRAAVGDGAKLLIMRSMPAEVANDAIVLELASKPGITAPSVIDARGLPGKLAPAESGKLIAETVIRLSL